MGRAQRFCKVGRRFRGSFARRPFHLLIAERKSRCGATRNRTEPASWLQMRATPQPQRPDPPKLRRGSTFDVQNVHRATADHAAKVLGDFDVFRPAKKLQKLPVA